MPSTPRIALITGGNRGIGRSTALHLARAGVDVVLTYRSHADEATAVVGEITDLGRTAVALELDAGAVATFDAFAETLGRALRDAWGRDTFDVLVNNAGISHGAHFADTTEEDFDRLVDVHFKGVFFLTQRLLPLLADGGAIANLSTGLTRATFPQRATYAAVKGAVEVLTLHLAAELGPRGIRVNTIAPGAVATDFSGGVVRDNPQVAAQIASVTALGRTATADDIGSAMAALLGDGTGWITGQRIEVSGGLHL
jgi:NAD(P)-dependent dehydrogenase (short-subunit alcohol dehydrogenase family)